MINVSDINSAAGAEREQMVNSHCCVVDSQVGQNARHNNRTMSRTSERAFTNCGNVCVSAIWTEVFAGLWGVVGELVSIISVLLTFLTRLSPQALQKCLSFVSERNHFRDCCTSSGHPCTTMLGNNAESS